MSASLPSSLRAGDTLSGTFDLSDYPASASWVLSFTLINASAKQTITCTASGDLHVLSVPAATTAGWAAGLYTYTAHVTKSPLRYTVGSGQIQVLPDLSAATTYDGRTPARRALEAAEAALATYGSKAYTTKIAIGDREQTFASPGDFLAFMSRLRQQVRAEEDAERAAAGLGKRNRIMVRFNGR